MKTIPRVKRAPEDAAGASTKKKELAGKKETSADIQKRKEKEIKSKAAVGVRGRRRDTGP